jgi:hypothetical protein
MLKPPAKQVLGRSVSAVAVSKKRSFRTQVASQSMTGLRTFWRDMMGPRSLRARFDTCQLRDGADKAVPFQFPGENAQANDLQWKSGRAIAPVLTIGLKTTDFGAVFHSKRRRTLVL